MKRSIIHSSIAGILLSLSLPAFAEEGEEDLYLLYGDEDMISIATGSAQPIAKAPSTASIITAEDIKAMGATTLDEVMERVPGVHVAQSVLSFSNNFTFRGLRTGLTPQVLIMLNGYRISSDVFHSTLIDGSVSNVQNISRIEVIRGPGSAVYGADAYSGVINIVTKNSKEIDGINMGVKTGSFNTSNVWGQYGAKIGNDWNISVMLEYAKKEADDSQIIASDLQSTFDFLFGSSASLAPGHLESRYEATTFNIHANNDNWKIGLDSWIQRDNGTVAGVGHALDPSGKIDIDQFLFTSEYSKKDILDDLDFTAKLSYQTAEQQSQLNIFPAGTVLPVGLDGNIFSWPADASCPANANLGGAPACLVTFTNGYIGHPGRKSTTPQLDFIFSYHGMLAHDWRVNLGTKKEKLNSNESKNFGPGIIDGTVTPIDGTLTNATGVPTQIYVSDENRTINYISIQDIWEFAPDWSLTAGVRYDDYSDVGDTTNPRVALVWGPEPNLTTKLLYGSAFRAPSFSELYAKNNPVGVGNVNLKPEEIDTLELAFSYEPITNLTAGLSIYKFEAENMIDFIQAGNNKVAQNITNLTGQGFEIELDWIINDELELLANYANQSTKNDATDAEEAFNPKQQLYVDVRWKFTPKWIASSQLNLVNDRERAQGDTRSDVDDYTLVDLTIRQKNNDWEFAASIKNLFDKAAFEPSDTDVPGDYPLHERAFFIEASYKLN